MLLTSIVMYLISPWAKSKAEFFKAAAEKKSQPKFWLLTSSLVISWIFAKSIAIAASLGYSFGLVGGLSYAAYYLSFLVAGIILVNMRKKGNFESIHHFLQSKYGKGAVRLFTLLIVFRLFNEVWSNTMVVGLFFGEKDSAFYYLAILVFTSLTLGYVVKGGMKSSLATDAVQMTLFVLFIGVILYILIPGESSAQLQEGWTGEWVFSNGINLMLVAFIQVFSYPFHDPVLTDRAFLSDYKTTLKSFTWATIIGVICITLFSMVGVFAKSMGLEGEPVMAIGRTIGMPMMLLMNLIMITSATSTLDSTFTSFSKMWVVDLGRYHKATISKGRLAMAFLALFGTIPVFLGSEMIAATTISGTMVMGLAPVFIFWKSETPKAAFFVSVLTGVVFGVGLTLSWFPKSWFWTNGKYNDLLWVNAIGTTCCFVLFFMTKWSIEWRRKNA